MSVCLTVYSVVVAIFTARFNVQKLRPQLTECVYGLCLVFRINNDYLP